MNPYFRRENNQVVLGLDSGLKTCKPIYLFRVNCTHQEEAELLKRHMEEVLYKFQKKIALNPELYLDPHGISQVKAKLKDWNGREHCWK